MLVLALNSQGGGYGELDPSSFGYFNIFEIVNLGFQIYLDFHIKVYNSPYSPYSPLAFSIEVTKTRAWWVENTTKIRGEIAVKKTGKHGGLEHNPPCWEFKAKLE